MADNYKNLNDNDINLNIDYNECCLSSITRCCNSKICNFKKDWPRRCVYIDELLSNVVNYLISIKVINKHQQFLYSINEKELLMNRLSRLIDVEQPNLKICPNHRFTFGTGWSIPESCVYLKENGEICHVKTDRVAPMHLIKYIFTFPYGGKICSKHRNDLYQTDAQTNAITTVVSGAHLWEIVSDDFDHVNDILTTLQQSPLKSQASQIPIQDQATSSQRRLISKLRKSVAASAISFANSIAPGQADKLIELAGLSNVLNIRSSSTTPTADDQVIQRLVEIYNAFEQKQHTFTERIHLLALLPESMGEKEIMEKFSCSQYAVRTARELQLATKTSFHNEEHETGIRNRINPVLTDHFLSWLLDTNMLTTVAWGVTKVKLDRGDVLEIPKQVLQAKKSHIIHQYQLHCQEMSIKPLSHRTLHYILEGIGASEQEALSGIDDIVKDAREAWIKLEELLSSFKMSKEDRTSILALIKQSKLYLKTLFINHCYEAQTKTCITHCTVYSLSQQGGFNYNEKCNHYHTEFCQDCTRLIKIMDFFDHQIDKIVDIEQRNELRYDFQQAREAIIELMGHLIRAVQQNDAKSKLLDQMDQETAFVTIDWTQKILQQKHREGQSEYYAKKGMSVLVASFTIKDFNQPQQKKFITKTYMLALSRCNQNELDTLSGGYLLLQQFKNEHQHINKLIKRSDNASVLSGHATFECEKILADQLGIKILVRDYSEVQHGKSICDRIAGAAKMRMRAYINAGNNLLNASDIKKGMEYCGGVKNVKIGVAELINNQNKIDNSITIPEISLIRSVVYTDDGMIIRKASNIGQGRLIPYSNLQVTLNMKLIEPFSPSNHEISKTKPNERIDRKMISFYFCPEQGCMSTFKNETELNDHIVLGQHLTVDEKMTAYDVAKIQLFDKLHDINLSTSKTQSITTSSSTTTISTVQLGESTTMKYFKFEGWALKVHKPRRPIDTTIKSFIKSIMDEEKLYSVKFTEKDFVRRIRTARRDDGTKMFSPDQYLTCSQVKTQIKLLSKRSSSDAKQNKTVVRNDDDNDLIDQDKHQQRKTPKLSRKHVNIRRSIRNASTTAQSTLSPNTHHIYNQDTPEDETDEEDEKAFVQEQQIDVLKRKILSS